VSPAVWALIGSVVGGIVGAGVKFTFEDVLRPKLGWRRDTQRVVSRFTTPLIRSAEALERRINNLVRNEGEQWFDTSEYYRFSTLYVFGEHLGWIRIIERRFGFVPIEAMRRGRAFTERLYGVFRGLTSFAYFRAYQSTDVEKSAVPRLMLTAIGEAMIATDRESVIEFTEFATRYINDPQFARWFVDLDQFLRRVHPENPLSWDRALVTGAELLALLAFLDPKGRVVSRRALPNLDRLATPGLREQLVKELAPWASPPSDDRQLIAAAATTSPSRQTEAI
jgi:hypothetical protein